MWWPVIGPPHFFRVARGCTDEGQQAQLEGIRFVDGMLIERRALFIRPGQAQQSRLAQNLDCKIGEGGIIIVDDQGQTRVVGVYAAGAMTRQSQQIILPLLMARGPRWRSINLLYTKTCIRKAF
jgi:thioredoxin reductase